MAGPWFVALGARRCVHATAPLGPFALTPAAPQRIAAGATLEFEAGPAPSGVVWSVDGVVGGSAATGTIANDGTFVAPERLLDGPILTTVTATDAGDDARTATVDVSLYAQGTVYVLEFGDRVAVGSVRRRAQRASGARRCGRSAVPEQDRRDGRGARRRVDRYRRDRARPHDRRRHAHRVLHVGAGVRRGTR